MSLLNDLTTDKSIIEEQDSLGGAGILESNIYLLTLTKAFVSVSGGGAKALNIHAVTDQNHNLTQQFWLTSGTAKGCKNFYINPTTKEKHYLPGFNMANSLCLLTIGSEIGSLTTEKKTVMLYNYEDKKEVPTDVEMITPLLGKKIYAGVLKQKVDKRAKNPDTGDYEPTGETRYINEIDKFFRLKDKLTVTEIKARSTTPAFFDSWMKKWQNMEKDKTTKVTNQIQMGKPSAHRATPSVESLFS